MLESGVTISSLSVAAISQIRSGLFDFLDAALHIEISFRHIVVFAFENFLEPAHGIGNGHLLAFATGEHLRDRKGLAEEALNFARTKDHELIIGRKFIHT